MAQAKFGSAGVSAREIDLSGPVAVEPVGVPAGVIGTAVKGPAFVPITVGIKDDFTAKFGETDGKKFGPLAVHEWLRRATAVTYVRTLGVGDGLRREVDGDLPGRVASAGFVVGEQQPYGSTGQLSSNPYANPGANSVQGRTYFLGCFMSESAGSTVFSSAGLQGTGGVTPVVSSSVPIVRAVVMAPSGVVLRLSSSVTASVAPGATVVATEQSSQGSIFGNVILAQAGAAKQEFVLLLNGHQGTDPLYPNVITASFDMTAPNYFANALNADPLLFQRAGHCLYAHWDVHPATATVTGSGLTAFASGSGGVLASLAGAEHAAFITTGTVARNTGSNDVPNFENFEDRFRSAMTPWVVSQRFGGTAVNLFRLHLLDAGAGPSVRCKFSIENIAPSGDPANRYGTFDLIVRAWSDRDSDQRPLEQWRQLSLDPSSDRYIAKVIGDLHAFYDFDRAESAQKLVIDGSYQNQSNYVRVEVSDSVSGQAVDPTALPVGHRGIFHLVTSGSAPLTSPASAQMDVAGVLKRSVTPPVPMRLNVTAGSGAKKTVNPLLYWGTHFEHVTSLTTPNASTLANESLESFALYFPDFATDAVNFTAGANEGVVDTDANGMLDADRFCRNAFTLENIQVVTSSTGDADPQEWVTAVYVRSGEVGVDETAKTRRFKVTDLTQANRRFAKFTFFSQGGFDGVNVFDADEAGLTNTAVTNDMDATNRGRNLGPNVRAYAKALEIMENVVNVDIQLLAIPGIRHPIVTDAASAAVKERFDALYIMDVEQYDDAGTLVTTDAQLPSVTATVAAFAERALDSSFAAAYFPDVVITDPTVGTNVVAPPSVAVLGAIALNDAIGQPWFAPAGNTRGSLSSVLEARVKLSKDNMDALYDASINPIVAFPGNAAAGLNPKGGVVVWGQKTLQAAASALDRINVRRLLIEIRRQVRLIAQTIVFEPNREATLARFADAIKPKLARIQALQGVTRFLVKIDTTTTTQTDIDNNRISGKIFVQPTKSTELVGLDFVVANNMNQVA